MSPEEQIAEAFHKIYERNAPFYSHETRKETAVPWDQVPERNRQLMISVVTELLDAGTISIGFGLK